MATNPVPVGKQSIIDLAMWIREVPSNSGHIREHMHLEASVCSVWGMLDLPQSL